MEKTGGKSEKMERHSGKNRRKDAETKKPCPQRCLCHKGMYADTKKGAERGQRERKECPREMKYLWKCSVLCCGFWVLFLLVFYIITDFSGISVFSND